MRKILSYVLIASLLVLPACSLIGGGSSTPTTTINICDYVNTVEITQTAVIAAATVFATVHKTSPTTISADVYAKAGTAYTAWASAQPLVASALVAINDSNGNPSAVSVNDYTKLAIQAAGLATQFLTLYNQMKATAPQALSAKLADTAPSVTPTPVATPTPVVCTETDAAITQLGTVPAWTSF